MKHLQNSADIPVSDSKKLGVGYLPRFCFTYQMAGCDTIMPRYENISLDVYVSILNSKHQVQTTGERKVYVT